MDRRPSTSMRALIGAVCVLLVTTTATATPSVAFPFNSQVPLVPRVNEQYSFQFSESTFAPDPENLTYSLSDQPAWLTVDSATRTLQGMPGQADVGTATFVLIAADSSGTAQMSCTLVVSSNPAPQLEGDISTELAASTNISSSQPPVATILPATPFHLTFQRDSFIDSVQRKLSYYATLTDHTPLPSWMDFDGATLTFTGTAPELSAFPQSWAIDLIASDVVGFAGAIASFTVAVGTAQLAFVPQEQNVSVSAGMPMHFTSLQDELYQNGVQITPQQLQAAQAAMPSWLEFNTSTLSLQGTAPDDVTNQNVSVTVADSQGGVATAVINLVVGVDSTPLAAGTPTGTATGSAASSTASQSSSVTKHSTSTPSTLLSAASSQRDLHGGVIAAIVVLSLISAGALIALLLWCCRRRRRSGSYLSHSPAPSKSSISKPVIPQGKDVITVTTEVQRDVEKADGAEQEEYTPVRVAEPPPQISLSLPPQSTAKKWFQRASHISAVSSLGNGEDAIRADQNIPELGRQSAALLHTPHDSFALPTEIARRSRQLEDASPSKRIRRLRRLKEKRRSEQSVGLGIDVGMSGALPRHSSRRTVSQRKSRNSHAWSGTQHSPSMASLSTRGTSVLSTRASDFPRPPPKSTFSGLSVPSAAALTEAEKRQSIRMVARSDSVGGDDRPLADKRQSFIRNRASIGLQSPLFAHGSRAPSVHGRPTTSSTGSLRRSVRGKSMLATYSESSSLEPRARDPRPFQARIRSTFAPNFPRAVTRSSLGTAAAADDDDTTSSGFYTTESSLSGHHDLAAEMALPRQQRTWVLPGEASPTPPPVSRHGSTTQQQRRSMPRAESEARLRWKEKVRAQSSSSISSSAVAVPPPPAGTTDKEQMAEAAGRASQVRRSRLSEPISLVSMDSISRARPRLVNATSKRPVSLNETQRLSSLKADCETATTAGSERWEDGSELLEGTGLRPVVEDAERKTGTQRSDVSGPAFL